MMTEDPPDLSMRLMWKLFFMVLIAIMLVTSVYFVFVRESETESTWPSGPDMIDY